MTTVPLYNLTDTWNNGATTFTAIQMNVANTASNAASLLIDLQNSNTSTFSVNAATGEIKFGSGVQSTNFLPGSFSLSIGVGNYGEHLRVVSNGAVYCGDGANVSFGFTLNSGGSADVLVYRDNAANILGQRNGTNAQIFRVYGTFTDSGNFERGGFDWAATAGVLRIRSEAAGTGTQRIIAVDGFNKAGAPANTDIPSGTYGFLRDTSGSHTYLIYNNAGTIQKIELV